MADGCEKIIIEHNYVNYEFWEPPDVKCRLENDTQFLEEYVSANIKTENVEEEDNEVTFTWSQKSTKLLLQFYSERKEDFRDPKIRKKVLWAQIVREFVRNGYKGVTEDVLDRKFRNLKQRYKTIKKNYKFITGQSRSSWEYFEEFEELYLDDPIINNMDTTFSSLPQSSSVIPTLSSLNMSRIVPASSTSSSFLLIPTSPNIPVKASELTTPNLTTTIPRISPNSSANNSSSSSDGTPENRYKKRKRLHEFYEKSLEIEQKRVELLQKLNESMVRSNAIQRERNKIFRQILEKK